MANETRELALFAAKLRFQDIPAPVVQRAKDCIADTIATIAFGARLPWSRIVMGYAERTSGRGKSRMLAPGGPALASGAAALANGSLAHAFELDNLTWPNSGVHPGATMFVPALAVAQERGIGGRDLITAFVAGAEIMIRIGRATKHNNETRGYHAPGTTGPFGGAVAIGRLLKFDAETMTNAMGIAGSMSSGLLEFARSGTGAMVKRLHMGRAAEGGLLAASLAAEGFTGPQTVLEGPFGFLNVFCGEYEIGELTKGLGQDWATLRILLKRFPLHITSHTAVQAVEDLRAEHGYSGDDVASITVAGTPKMAGVHNIPAPADVMLAQYSLPFNVAMAHYKNPRDPASFTNKTVADPAIRSLASRVSVSVSEEGRRGHTLATTTAVTLKDGRTLTRRVDSFKGTPDMPLSREEMRDKFLLLTQDCDRVAMSRLFDRIQNLEHERKLDWVKIPRAKAQTVTRRKVASRAAPKRRKAA